MDPPRRRIIRKKSGGHGHHGGAWKIAYADFVTAMMALFMVMWMIASTDTESRKEISEYFRTGILPTGDMAMKRAAQFAPSVFDEAPIPPPKGEETLADPLEETAESIKSRLANLATLDPELAELTRSVVVHVTDEGVLIEAVDQDRGLLFEISSATLKPALVRLLTGLAPVLADTGAPIEINGHTDARPFVQGAVRSNWDLSFIRADAARQVIEQGGVPASAIGGVFARGHSQLYVPEDPYAAQNRRLSLLIRAIPGGGKSPGKP